MADESTGNTPGGKADRPLPNCKALLLCSKVIVDDFTKEPSLIGVLNRLDLAEFPGTSMPFAAFLQLADGIGEYNLTVEVHDLQENDGQETSQSEAWQCGTKFQRKRAAVRRAGIDHCLHG